MQLAVAHGGNRFPAGARGNLFGTKLLAAPGTEDEIGLTSHDFAGIGDDAVACERFFGEFGKHVVAARNADEFGDPADTADGRFVPLLEVHARSKRQALRTSAALRNMRFRFGGKIFGFARCADHGAEPADVAEDAGHGTVVADPYLDAGTDQVARDIGLDIGETDYQVRLQVEDGADLRAGEGGYFRLFPARARRAHGESRYADDAIFLAQRIEHFGRLFGQADDALRIGIVDAHQG